MVLAEPFRSAITSRTHLQRVSSFLKRRKLGKGLQGDETPSLGPFNIIVTGVNDWQVYYKMETSLTKSCLIYVVERETYDTFSSDEYFWDYIIQQSGDYSSKLETGDISQRTFDYLKPSTRYVIYCGATDMEGKLTEERSLKKISTGAPVTFELDVDINGNEVNMIARPSYDNSP